MNAQPVVMINPFEVPPDADEAFIAGWERARDFLETHRGFERTALHRSVTPNADFRFVNVALLASADAWRNAIARPDFPGGRMPFRAHPALYRVVREDASGADDGNGVTLINAFEVPAGADEAFVAAWEGAQQFMQAQRGYWGTRLHEAVSPQADFRFVNIARWESVAALGAAMAALSSRAAAFPFRAHPAAYEVIRQ